MMSGVNLWEISLKYSLGKLELGGMIAYIFCGLWLFHLGYLVFESGLLPRILGILLTVSCFGYLL